MEPEDHLLMSKYLKQQQTNKQANKKLNLMKYFFSQMVGDVWNTLPDTVAKWICKDNQPIQEQDRKQFWKKQGYELMWGFKAFKRPTTYK